MILIVAFYRIVGKMEHTTFWDGIRTSEHVEPYLAVCDVATELVIDQDDGLLRPMADGESPDISVVTYEENLNLAPARIIQHLVDQFLVKSTALSLFPEMTTMLAVRVSDWIRTYDERLDKLESNLSDDLHEMPKGFSEFMTNARRELGDIESFCRQTGDMLDDITRVAEAGGYEHAAYQCKTIARQLGRLAEDAEDVRDLAGEIRSGYQERFEVRQNNVMSMLTIVETVFTPLALVTGWYGMNFVNMPELRHPDAYFIVVGILTFLIAIEFAIFKRRRWF